MIIQYTQPAPEGRVYERDAFLNVIGHHVPLSLDGQPQGECEILDVVVSEDGKHAVFVLMLPRRSTVDVSGFRGLFDKE